MTLRPIKNLRNYFFCLSVLFCFCFLSAPVCSATVNRSTAVVRVSTTTEDNWYDWNATQIVSSSNPLHSWASCDKVGCTSNNTTCKNKYQLNSLCNNDSDHSGDFLYTDTEDETNTYLVSSNFTITASASASSGSMDGVKIEWISESGGYPADSDWTTAAKGPGSFTCSGTGSCTVCVQGGTCVNDVIPQSMLGVHSNGTQRRFYFRATFTSGTDKATTGYDSADALDKYYWFVICGPACSAHTCNDHAPTVAASSVTPAANLCNGLNDTDGFYKVNWTYAHMPSNTTQTYYKVSLRKAGTTTVLKSYYANAAATSYKIPTSWLAYGTTYEWQVEAKFSGQGCAWDIFSPWSTGAANIVVPARYPVPAFTVKNPAGADCLAGSCLMAESLTFDGSSSATYSGGTTTYTWVQDGVTKTGSPFSQTFNTKPHTTKLTVRDGGGRSCSLTKSFTLGDAAPVCATNLSVGISEVAPADLCNGFNDVDGFYTLKWVNNNVPVGAAQTYYKISFKPAGMAGPIQTSEANSAATSFKVPSSWMAYNGFYEWQVQVKIAGAGCNWDLTSPSSSADGTLLTTPARYPVPAFSIKNPGGTDCVSGGCLLNENITFDASASTSYSWNAAYAWDLDSNPYSGVTLTKNFTSKNHTVKLTVTDGAGCGCAEPGRSCSLTKAFDLGDAAPVCDGTPATSLASVFSPMAPCGGLDDVDGYYALSWGTSNIPAGTSPTHYKVTVRNTGTGAIQTAEADSAGTMFQVPTAWLTYGTTYDWKVDVTVAGSGCSYVVSSSWSSGATNIVVPARYPSPVMTVKNPASANCFVAGTCHMGESITFDGSSSVNYAGGTLTYAWNLDGTAKSSASFAQSFVTKPHTVGLTVTDKFNHSCSAPVTNVNLGDAVCGAGPTVAASTLTHTGSFCDGLYYTVEWQPSGLPAGAVQTSYTVTVRNVDDTTESNSATNGGALKLFSIPGAWLNYETHYEWQVEAHYVSADGLCSWTATSPWSTGALSITTPHQYPVPVFTVKDFNRDPSGVDCFIGECYLLDEITFDGTASQSYEGTPTYNWNLDGTAYSTASFVKKFTDRNHTVSLTVGDGAGYACTSSNFNLNLEKTNAIWNEVAPR